MEKPRQMQKMILYGISAITLAYSSWIGSTYHQTDKEFQEETLEVRTARATEFVDFYKNDNSLIFKLRSLGMYLASKKHAETSEK